MSNQQLDLNTQTNQNNFPQEENYNINISNYELDMLQQKQIIDKLSLEDLMKKIEICLKENNLSELENILKLSEGKIPKSILSSYISENIQNINIIRIFLNYGADINSYIHYTNYKIAENEKINLLMFSIMTENVELFKLVLQYHPDVLQEDKNKKNSIFYYISFNEEPNMLHELLHLNPAAINTIYYDSENNLTHNLLTFAVLKNKKDLCSILIKDNCNLNYQIPETGDTFLHLIVKNDNLEIAKLLYSHPNIDKSLKNKEGKTAKELGEEKKGNIFFQIICKEDSNNSNNNNNGINVQNKNINNLINGEQNIKANKKGNDIFSKITANLNEINISENEKNSYDINQNDNYVVPIEFNNVDYNTYLSMGQEMKLCLNIFKEEEILIKEKEELLKKKEKYKSDLEILIKEQKDKNKDLNQLENEINEKGILINTKKEEINQKKRELQNIELKTEKYSNFLKKLSEEDPQSLNQDSKIQGENIEININTEENNSENINNEPPQLNEEPITEEKFKFLKEKFESKSYERNYMVKCLQKDLEDYQQYIHDEIENRQDKIKDIITQLQSVVNEIDKNYKVNLYGSYSTGLCLPWSDIDTVITSLNGNYDSNFLTKLNTKLSHEEWVKDQTFLDRATIPIIKLVSTDEFNFHIDISMSSETHFGLKTVTLVKEYLGTYKVLKPIILALKTLLKNGGLNDPYKGGLSSYGLILMVVSFIQSEIDNEKYNEDSPTIIGETFLNVLGHYGIFFDYNNYVIITYPVNAKNDNIDKDNTYQFIPNTHELIIVDPLNKQNNVAKSTFQFMNIKMGFLIAFMVAKEDCECGCHYEYLKNKRDIEHGHCILKRIFNSIKSFKDANKNIY